MAANGSPSPIILNSRAKCSEINALISCILCKGYLIDATTINECVHSYCKTCLVKHLKTNNTCPKCKTVIRETKPFQNIRPDPTLQDIVYKMIPGLYEKEMDRRKKWYLKNPKSVKKVSSGEEVGERSGERTIYSATDFIPISLQYVPLEINYTYSSAAVQCGNNACENDKNNSNEDKNQENGKQHLTNTDVKSNGLPTAMTTTSGEHGKVRYFRCVAAVTVRILKKLLRSKFDLKYHHEVEIFYKHDLLFDDYSILDIAYIYSWKRNNPIALYYKITDLRTVHKRKSVSRDKVVQRRSKTCTTTTQTEPLVVEKGEKKKAVVKKKKMPNEKVAHISPQPRKDSNILPNTFALPPSVSITPIISPSTPSIPLTPMASSRPSTPVVKAFATPAMPSLNTVTGTVTVPPSTSSISFMNGPPAFPGMKPKVATSLVPSSLSFSPSLSSTTVNASAVCTVQPLAINGCTLQPIPHEETPTEPESLTSNGDMTVENNKDRDLLSPPPLSIVASPENISAEDVDKIQSINSFSKNSMNETDRKLDFLVKNSFSAKNDRNATSLLSKNDSMTFKRDHTSSPLMMMYEPSSKMSKTDFPLKTNGHLKSVKEHDSCPKSKISDKNRSLDDIRQAMISHQQSSSSSLVLLQKVLDLITPREQDQHKS